MGMAEHTPGERIAEIRKTYSISKEDLAERSGVSVELISIIEDSGHIPDLAPLIKISRGLGVRLALFLTTMNSLVLLFAGQGRRHRQADLRPVCRTTRQQADITASILTLLPPTKAVATWSRLS